MRPTRRLTNITYEVSVVSSENDEAIREPAKKAADDCYVTKILE